MTNMIYSDKQSEEMLLLFSIANGKEYMGVNPCVAALVYSVMIGELSTAQAIKEACVSYPTAHRWISLFRKSGVNALSFPVRRAQSLINIILVKPHPPTATSPHPALGDRTSENIDLSDDVEKFNNDSSGDSKILDDNEESKDTEKELFSNIANDSEGESLECNETVKVKHKDAVSIYFVNESSIHNDEVKEQTEIEHELICGDCLEELKNIPDDYFDLVLADPPFGTTNQKWDTVIDYELLWKELKRISKKTTPIALFAATPYDKFLAMSNIGMYKYEWIWMKEQGTGQLNAKRQPLRQHENVLMFYEKQPLYNPQFTEGKPYHVKRDIKSEGLKTYSDISAKSETISDGSRYPTSILRFNRELKNRFHPTQKPVLLLEYLIKTFTNEGDRVLDFCMGSGSTGVACRNLNRNFVGIEKEERYFDVAVKRIKNKV